MHARHWVQSFPQTGLPSSIRMVCTGQTFSQIPQPVHFSSAENCLVLRANRLNMLLTKVDFKAGNLPGIVRFTFVWRLLMTVLISESISSAAFSFSVSRS
jgi:hypothetical protein